MKRSLLASLLLAGFIAGCASTPPAAPENWVPIDHHGHFIDINSIKDIGDGMKEAQEKNVFSPPMKGRGFTHNKPIAIAIFKNRYDCRHNRHAAEVMSFYGTQQEVLYSVTLTDDQIEWEKDSPESVGEMYRKAVCRFHKHRRK